MDGELKPTTTRCPADSTGTPEVDARQAFDEILRGCRTSDRPHPGLRTGLARAAVRPGRLAGAAVPGVSPRESARPAAPRLPPGRPPGPTHPEDALRSGDVPSFPDDPPGRRDRGFPARRGGGSDPRRLLALGDPVRDATGDADELRVEPIPVPVGVGVVPGRRSRWWCWRWGWGWGGGWGWGVWPNRSRGNRRPWTRDAGLSAGDEGRGWCPSSPTDRPAFDYPLHSTNISAGTGTRGC